MMLLQRKCGCGGACGACSKEKKDSTPVRPQQTKPAAASRLQRDLTAVPAHSDSAAVEDLIRGGRA